MSYIRITLGILAVAFHFLVALFFIPFPYSIRVGIGRYVLGSWAVVSTWIFGIKVIVHGEKPKVPGGTLVIANHISYFDIFVLASLFPTVYLSKKEVLYIPMLGWGAYAIGVVFVDRGNKKSGAKSIEDMVKRLQSGATLVVFPEGTTADVDDVREFKMGAFRTAIQADIPVRVMAFTYENFEQEQWTDEGLGAHISRNTKRGKHVAHVVYGNVLHLQGMDVKKAAYLASEEMKRVYKIAKEKRDEAEQLKQHANG